MSIGDTKSFSIEYDGLKLQVDAFDNADGTVTFTIAAEEGYADINALYWSNGVDDGSSFSLGKSLNMNGSGEEWDAAEKLSSTGLGGGDEGTFVTAGGEPLVRTFELSWDDLDTLGVRATSTSTAEGSIKGVDDEACVVYASILVNGSFEEFANGEIGPTDTNWKPVAEGNVPGWDNGGTGAGSGFIEVWDTPHSGVAADGSKLIETDYAEGVDALTQVVDAQSGVDYTLSFDFASRFPAGSVQAASATDSFQVYWNGELKGTYDPTSTTFQTATLTVTGADGNDTLEFREAGLNEGLGGLIDNVSLAIPPTCSGYLAI